MFKLRIDANAGYDADTSIRLARMVAPYGLQLFEQPVPADDIAGMARVRREAAVGIPIMADESVLDHASLIRIIQANAADIVKVKVMKQGGFINTRRMIATAEAAGIRCVVGHGFGLGINTMAEIMLAATSSNVIDGLECVGPLKTVRRYRHAQARSRLGQHRVARGARVLALCSTRRSSIAIASKSKLRHKQRGTHG